MPTYDVAIIGAGTTGLAIATMAAAQGKSAVLFERERLGGASYLKETVPLRLLSQVAKQAAAIRSAPQSGLEVNKPNVKWTEIKRQIQQAVRQAGDRAGAELGQLGGVDIVRASAHFIAPDRLEAAGRVYTFRRVAVATGAETVIPNLPGLAACPWLTTADLLASTTVPEHLLILGGGPDGVEVAQAYARLDCQVTLITARPNLLEEYEPEPRLQLREALRRDGVNILENTKAQRAFLDAGEVGLQLPDGATLRGSHLVIATGRMPRLQPLDLTAGGIEATSAGIESDPDLRSTTNRRVWAFGASSACPNPGLPRASQAAAGATLLARRSPLLGRPTRHDFRPMVRIVRSDPELMQVGLTEAEARARGKVVKVIRRNADALATLPSKAEFSLKVVLDDHENLLGISLLREDASRDAGWFLQLMETNQNGACPAGPALRHIQAAIDPPEGMDRRPPDGQSSHIAGWASRPAR